jgi:hypothetical protein
LVPASPKKSGQGQRAQILVLFLKGYLAVGHPKAYLLSRAQVSGLRFQVSVESTLQIREVFG